MMNELAAVQFFHVWDTYAKVVAANYMFHRELGAAVKAALRGRFGARPFSVLDLGCGDAATFAPLLEDFALERYRGADLSEAALALARRNLAGLSCPVELTRADLLSELSMAPQSDVIYVSFALHHLATQAKAEFFQRATQKLTPGGLLLLVDVVREEGESLPAYHAAYCSWLRDTMAALDESEKDAICDHLVNNDFPEPCSVLMAQAESAGLQILETATPQKWHRLLSFKKP
ncbi:MAG TPA: class I SAM-dependent methyltransferase [Methylocystis sp.]|jgi:SAM-dependent methyltransferase